MGALRFLLWHGMLKREKRKKNKELFPLKKVMLLILCCFLLAGSCLAADYTVTKLVSDAVVDENGTCQMTQTLDMDIQTATNEIVIPVASDARKISISGISGRSFRRDGKSYARLRPAEGFTGPVTVTISYVTEGTVEATEQGQRFTLELVSTLWEQQIDRYSFTMVLPSEVAAQPSYFSSYHADDVEDKLTTAMKGRGLSGQLRGGLLDRESFTVKLDVPQGYFPISGAGSAKGSVVGQWICGILGLLIAAAAVYYWFMFLRSGSRLRVQARTTPPETLTPADVPYLLSGAKPDFALLVCHWGSLGYLTITMNSAGRVLLRKSMSMGTERREEERKLFELLFGESDVCEAGGSRYTRTAEVAQTALKRYWVRRLFDRKSGSPMIVRAAATLVTALALMSAMIVILPPSGWKWLLVITAFVAGGACGTAVWYGCARLAVRDWLWVGIGGGALLFSYLMANLSGSVYLMLLALILCLAVGIVTRHGGRRTASGSDMVEQTRGFCRFLGHAEDQHLVEMLHRDGQYFYSMMLYAAACGQGRTFARRFGDMELENCGYLSFAGQTPSKAYPYYLRFEQLIKLLQGGRKLL